MPLQKLPVRSLDTEERRRLVAERINGILDHQFDDSRNRTAAEVSAGVTPINPAYRPGDVRRYGAKADGVTDCTASFASAVSVGGSGQPIIIPEGTYLFTNGWTITSARREIICEGHVTIYRPSGAGSVMFVDSGGDSTRLDGFKQRGTLILRGGSDVDYGLRLRGLQRSAFDDVRVYDVTDDAFRLEWVGLSKFNKLTCSDNVDTFATNPTNGLHVTRTNATRDSFANEFSCIVMEGPLTTGLYIEYGIYNHVISGTCEGVDNGVVLGADTRTNIITVACEENAEYDLDDLGENNSYHNCNFYSAGAQGTVIIASGCISPTFVGGFVREIEINSGARDVTLYGVQLSISSGITSSGPYQAFGCTNVNDSTLAYDSTHQYGAFTPSVQGGTTAGTQTYSVRVGRYQRIGKLVRFQIYVVLASNSGGSGNAVITGLPFTSSNTTNMNVDVIFTTNTGVTYSGSNNRLHLNIAPNASQGTFVESQDGSGATAVAIGSVGGTSTLSINGEYLVD